MNTIWLKTLYFNIFLIPYWLKMTYWRKMATAIKFYNLWPGRLYNLVVVFGMFYCSRMPNYILISHFQSYIDWINQYNYLSDSLVQYNAYNKTKSNENNYIFSRINRSITLTFEATIFDFSKEIILEIYN